MGRAGTRSSVTGQPAGRPQERVYYEMTCGNCFQSPCFYRESRYFSCTNCGEPAYECVRCVRIATERGFAAVTTCAFCSLAGEVTASEDAS